MDFGALPPEFNSACMYSGSGSAPMVAAASAWNMLAGELNAAATGYESVITRLSSEEWTGPASALMADAAAPYVAWMSAAAAQAEQAATQARSAAASYEAAFAATVPPPLIAANRAELQSLVSTNVLGQNAGAIAATQAQYGQMWAQDAAAMYEYAASSATATQVTLFTPPHQTTNPAGMPAQAAAVAQAAGSGSGGTQSTLSQMISTMPNALRGLASPTASTSSGSGLSGLFGAVTGSSTAPTSMSDLLTAYQPFASFFYNTEGLPYFSVGMGNNFVQIAKTMGLIGGAAPQAASGVGGAAAGLGSLPGLGGLKGLSGVVGGPVSAGFGQAASVGNLSVPSSWAGAGPALSPGAAVPVSTVSAAVPDAAPGNMMGGMPLAGAGGLGGMGGGPKYGFKPKVVIRPLFAG